MILRKDILLFAMLAPPALAQSPTHAPTRSPTHAPTLPGGDWYYYGVYDANSNYLTADEKCSIANECKNKECFAECACPRDFATSEVFLGMLLILGVISFFGSSMGLFLYPMAVRIVDKKLKDAKQTTNATIIGKETHTELRGTRKHRRMVMVNTLTVRYTVESDRSTVTKNIRDVSQGVYDGHFEGGSVAVLYLKPPEFDPRSSWLESTFPSAESIVAKQRTCGFINAAIFLGLSIYLTAPGVSWTDQPHAPYTCPAPWWGWAVGSALPIAYIARTLMNLMNMSDPEAQFKFAVNLVPGLDAWMKPSGEHRPEGSPEVEMSTMRANQAGGPLLQHLTGIMNASGAAHLVPPNMPLSAFVQPRMPPTAVQPIALNQPTMVTGTVVNQPNQPTMVTGIVVGEGSQLDSPASGGSEKKTLSKQIRDLAALRDQGILTDAEFTAAKTKLIA